MLCGVLAVWLCVSYGLRYGLMEDVQWVGICADQSLKWECQVRANLGLLIHFQVFGWGALATSVAGFILPNRLGRALGLLLAILALILYTASLAVFAVVIAGLRLVRNQQSM
jgi:hypothetical protein